MSAPEQQAAPEQPPADLRQRIDATIRPRMLIGLQDAELYDEPGRERIGEWADSITSWVMAEVESELAALRQQLAAVAALHRPVQRGAMQICDACSPKRGDGPARYVLVDYPCPTADALTAAAPSA